MLGHEEKIDIVKESSYFCIFKLRITKGVIILFVSPLQP